MKKLLPTVTLLGIDCVNIERLIQAVEICQLHFEFAEVKLLSSLPADQYPNIVHIDAINSTEEYSYFVINHLDEYINTDHVLIIQYDGFILNPRAWTDEFLQYDYIGAPWMGAQWLVERFDFPISLLGTLVVGNGGFSLRTKKFTSLCAKLAKENMIKKYHPEDLALCVYNRALFEENGAQFAPVELALKFSFEPLSEKDDKWNDQFGFHGLRWTDISKWTEKHPEYFIDNSLDKNKSK